MVVSPLEKLQNKKSFTDLIHLREELTKEAKNKERLTEYQKTIDLALEQGKKKGVIEFTESEWKTLISNENLPPVEEVKALLEEKITSAKEVASETKEKTGGIMEELQQKAESMTGEAKKKMEELQQKAEGLKKYTKPGLWILGIGLSLKIWGYKIANWFSGLFGKKGEYDEKLKLAEMEKEFLENPEAAMKKYGADALEKMKDKGSKNKEEGEKGVTEEGKGVEKKEDNKELEAVYGPMVPLKNHTETAKEYLGVKQRTLEAAYNDHKAEFLIGGALAMKYVGIGDFVSGAVGAGKDVGSFILHIAKNGGQVLKNHSIISTCAVIALLSGTKGLAEKPVPEDPKKLALYVENEVLHTPEAQAFLKEHGLTIDTSNLQEAIDNMTDRERLEKLYEEALGNVDNITSTAFEKIFPKETEHLKNIDMDGMGNFVKNLEIDPKKYAKTLQIAQSVLAKVKAEKRLISQEDLNPLIDAAQEEGILIEIGDTISYAIPDEDGSISMLPRDICSNPSESDVLVRFENAKRSNIGGQMMGFYREGIQEIGDIGRKLKSVWGKSDVEIAPVVDEILQAGACAIVVVGKEIILEGLYERYVLGTFETFGGVWDLITKDNKKLVAQEMISDYADGLVPIIALSYSESALNKVFQYRHSGKGKMSLFRPLVRGAAYPYNLAKGTIKGSALIGKAIGERILTGNWKDVFSDPKNEFTARFYEYINGVKGQWLRGKLGNDSFKILVHEQKTMSTLQGALSRLYRAKRKFYNSSILKETSEMVGETLEHFKDILPHDQIPSAHEILSEGKIEENIKKLENIIKKQKQIIDGATRKPLISAIEIRGNEFFKRSMLGASADTFFNGTENMSQADALKKARERVNADLKAIDDLIDDEILKRDELLKNKGKMPAEEYAKKMRELSERMKKLGDERGYHMKFGKVLDIHIHPRLKHLGRFKKLGLIGLGAGALYMMFNSGYKPQEMSEELKKHLDQTPDDMLDSTEGDKGDTGAKGAPGTEGDKGNIDSTEKEIASTTMKIRFERIAQSYDELELLVSDENADSDAILSRAIGQHEKNIEAIKNELRVPENKEILMELLKKSPETQVHITPFFSIEMKENKPQLAYLDTASFRKHFSDEIESGEFLEGLFGMKVSTNGKIAVAQNIGDAATYMIPIAGTIRDGYDSYEAFSRGDIGGGFTSLGWGALGLLSDIAIFTGVGAGLGAAGKAIRGAGAGVKGMKRVKLAHDAYKAARANFEILVTLAKQGKNLDNLSVAKKALVWNSANKGKGYLVAQGGQAGYMGMSSIKDTYVPLENL